ncbi:MAG: hypothetical protein V4440_12210 [Pseudomonadota bacterium]
MGILDQIAQPQMADIVGALDLRQKRLDADEAKRKDIRMGQLIAQAIPNLKQDSPIAEMAKNNPKEFMVFSKHLGIPLNDGEQMQQFANDTNDLYTAAQSDPKAAYQHAIELKAQRNAKGLETPSLDKFLAGMEDDPQRTMTGLFVTHRTLNQDEYNKREMDAQKMANEKRGLDIQDKRADASIASDQAQAAHWNRLDNAGQPNTDPNHDPSQPTQYDTDAENYRLTGKLETGLGGKAGVAHQLAVKARADELDRLEGVSPQVAAQRRLGNSQDTSAAGKALKDFDTGKQGNSVRSFNVSLSHLDTLSKLSGALENGDYPAVNKISNFFEQQSGGTKVNNFNAAKKIVGDEIVKAVVGAAGALGDREEIAKTINAAGSPAQLKGVIDNFKELMAGQLHGLKKQYEVSTKRNDFDRYLSDEAKPYVMGHSSDSSSSAAPATTSSAVKSSSIDDLVNKYAK